ncbi:T9SS type A sorting domain-containing protein [Flavobacterium sp.]|uniref:T9SS type A sorting domain-containing protein n=1 Tax=Flavobacterium sp. TaxID=239 RepID=UPI0033416877
MKKILLFTLILFGMSATAQNHTTGVINLTTGYTVKFDTNPTTVTMTLVGPSDKWLGLGFGMTTMSQTGDGVIVSGTIATLTDRNFTGSTSTPNSDSAQSWSTTSNTVAGTVRTIIATRALSTVDTTGVDFTFTNSTASINLIWALGSSLTLAYHGGTRGNGISGTFALSTDSFSMAGFKLYPNPADEIFAIELPDTIENITVKIFDVLGKEVMQKEISKLENKINTSDLSPGNYLVKVMFDDKSYATTLILQ